MNSQATCASSASRRLCGGGPAPARYNPRIMHTAALLFLVATAATAQTRADPARVARLMQRAVVIDLHDDTSQMIVDEAYNLAEKHDFGQVDVPRMRTGHVSGIFMSIWLPCARRCSPGR